MSKKQWKKEYGHIDPFEDEEKPTPTETPKSEYKSDQYGDYNPNAGSQTPTKGRCNSPLRYYESRYGEKRYCTKLPSWCFGRERDSIRGQFCNHHQQMATQIMRAKEIMKHGLYTKSLKQFYVKIEPWEKLFASGLYESLIEESQYDFEPEYDIVYLDVNKSEIDFEQLGVEKTENGKIVVEHPKPTKHEDRALALWKASLDRIKEMRINGIIFEDGIRTKTTKHIGTNESGHIIDKEKEYTEHSLNLPYDRLTRSRKEDLKYGGIDTNPSEEDSVNVTFEKHEWEDELPTEEEVIDIAKEEAQKEKEITIEE